MGVVGGSVTLRCARCATTLAATSLKSKQRSKAGDEFGAPGLGGWTSGSKGVRRYGAMDERLEIG